MRPTKLVAPKTMMSYMEKPPGLSEVAERDDLAIGAEPDRTAA